MDRLCTRECTRACRNDDNAVSRRSYRIVDRSLLDVARVRSRAHAPTRVLFTRSPSCSTARAVTCLRRPPPLIPRSSLHVTKPPTLEPPPRVREGTMVRPTLVTSAMSFLACFHLFFARPSSSMQLVSFTRRRFNKNLLTFWALRIRTCPTTRVAFPGAKLPLGAGSHRAIYQQRFSRNV